MTAHRGVRLDWSKIRDRVDLAAVATALLGPAVKRSGRRLIWMCPWDNDENPFLQVDPAKRRWKCWSCGEGGDAPALAMRVRGWTFPEAVRWLAEQAGILPPSGKPATRPRPPAAGMPSKAPDAAPEQPSGLPLADALKLVEDAAAHLWTPEGGDALAYLKGRGLTEETIRSARLGWTPGVSIPIREGTRFWSVSGIVIPWMDGDRLAMVKIRQPEGRRPKYVEAFRDRPTLFPAPSVVQIGRPLVVTEGEFDALLLGQALGDLAAVVTLGSASSKPEAAILGRMLAAAPWFVATDADEAGDRSASGWPARARRVRPPDPFKDWTEAAVCGVNLRRWWTDRLGGIERPPLRSWEELAALRWGLAVGDPTPGIIIDRPDRGRMLAAFEAAALDPYAIEERSAIQTEGCP
ncbi:MAG: CHC2 zinc finger domain-containing protein [Isosphaerales bacterium]